MVWYADGSIQVEANGQVATGTGTAFLKNVRIGDGLTIAGSASMHEVTNIASDTQLTFSPPYTGAAGAGKQYRIAPIQGYVKEAADRLREVLREVGPFMSSEALQALAEAETDQERRAAVSLGKVDNTADAEKPVSEPQRQAFVEKVVGKGLSQNDLTNDRAQKLDNLQSEAQKNPDAVTLAEAQGGAEAGLRSWSPVRVHDAIKGWYAATIKPIIEGLKQGSRMDVADLLEKTAGKLLQTGAGGWMGDVPVGDAAATDLDDRTMRGFRYVTSTTAGVKPGGVSYGQVLTFGNTGDAVVQELWELDGSAGKTFRKFMRSTYGSGAWGPWKEVTLGADLAIVMSGQVGTAFTGNPGISSGSKIPFNQFWATHPDIQYDSANRRFHVAKAGVYRATFSGHCVGSSNRLLIGVNNDAPTTSNHSGQAYCPLANLTLAVEGTFTVNAGGYIVFYVGEGGIYNDISNRFGQFSIERVG